MLHEEEEIEWHQRFDLACGVCFARCWVCVKFPWSDLACWLLVRLLHRQQRWRLCSRRKKSGMVEPQLLMNDHCWRWIWRVEDGLGTIVNIYLFDYRGTQGKIRFLSGARSFSSYIVQYSSTVLYSSSTVLYDKRNLDLKSNLKSEKKQHTNRETY